MQLGRELRRLREQLQIPREAAGQELECGVSKISRIENGKMTLAIAEVKALLALYKVDAAEAAEILDIAREARKRSTQRVPDWLRAYIGYEAEAVEIKNFQIDLVPGLFQTAAYTAEIARAADPALDDAEVELLVAIRQERQASLFSNHSPQLWVVMDEAALWRRVGGPAVMCEQLDKLREMAELPRVSIQVLPFRAGAHAAMGTPFTVLRLPDPPGGQVVYTERLWGADYPDRPDHIAGYDAAFDRLRACAQDAATTLKTIEKVISELK